MQSATSTSPKQTSLFTEEKLTSSQGDSHASHTAQQASDLERKMTATSGRRCLEQYEKFNRPTSWQKTFAASLIGTGEWYSTKCRLIWKLKATRSHRFYFQLVPSTLPTEGIESGLYRGLLPTVAAMDSTGIKNLRKDATVSEVGYHSMSLTHFAVAGLLPTPAASDYNAMGNQPNWEGSDLVSMIHKQTNQPGKTSQLNPLFVAEMMGFPPDWLELPFLSSETNQSKPTGTP